MAAKSRARSKQTADPRRSWWLGMLLFAVIVGSIGHVAHFYLSQPGRLPLRVVEISGEFQHLQETEVERRVVEHIDGGFFTVDMPAIRNAVLDMPWVAEVSVRRVWPDTLRMQVTEQLPLARWGEEALVNLHGEVFSPQPLPAVQGLPTLLGEPHTAPQMVAFYLKMRSQLVGSELRVAQLKLDARKEWQVHFDNGLQLVLGRELAGQRLQDFLHVYPQLLAQMPQRPQRIDMRYEHGFAVRWEPAVDGALALSGTTGGDS